MGRDVERVSPAKDPLATAVLMLLLGVVLIALGAGAVMIVVVFAGVMLMVYGASYISRGVRTGSGVDLVLGVIAAIVGLLLVIATGTMTSILIRIMGLFLIALGILAIVTNLDAGRRRRDTALAVGIVMVIIGVILAAYPSVATDLIMTVIGVIMVVVGALSLYTYLR